MGDDQFYIDQDFDKLPDSADIQISLLKFVEQEFINKSKREFNEKLESYLMDNLKNLGYKFETKKDLMDFCKNRLHRVSFGENFNNHIFYLDYIDEQNRGTLIGRCNDKLNIKYEGNKIVAVFGNQSFSKF